MDDSLQGDTHMFCKASWVIGRTHAWALLDSHRMQGAPVRKVATVSIGTPLCPYAVAYRRAYGVFCGWGRTHCAAPLDRYHRIQRWRTRRGRNVNLPVAVCLPPLGPTTFSGLLKRTYQVMSPGTPIQSPGSRVSTNQGGGRTHGAALLDSHHRIQRGRARLVRHLHRAPASHT